jgi:hypothetical protein
MHILKEISSNELNPQKFTSKILLLWYTERNLSVPEYNIQTRNLLAYLERYDIDLTKKNTHNSVSLKAVGQVQFVDICTLIN